MYAYRIANLFTGFVIFSLSSDIDSPLLLSLSTVSGPFELLVGVGTGAELDNINTSEV